MNHKLYEGTVTHERFLPKHHKLGYGFFQVYIDLDDIDSLASQSRWWSVEKFNLVSFRRKDYLPGDSDLKQAVINHIYSQTGKSFSGKVFLLTSLRYWGYCYNPVSFYFCYDDNNRLCFILDDINNTPWNERHCYVHDCELSEQSNSATIPSQTDDISNDIISELSSREKNKFSFHFDKAFHVSPFMPMNLYYEWHYTIKENHILIHMELFESRKPDKQLQFYANMNLKALPFNQRNAKFLPIKYPFLCGKVLLAIYWNALKLWIKKVPFYDHPNS